jgi:beta-lactamase regulating signal transducer with metallopeptidase domain
MNWVVLFLVEVTLVFALALLAVRVASGARAAVRHLILASAFGVVLILPLATLVSPTVLLEFAALPARAVDPVAATPIVAVPVEMEPRSTGTSVVATTAVSSTAAGSIPAATWLLVIWAVVSLLALVPVGVSLSRLKGIRRRGYPWPEGTARVKELARGAGMRPPVVVLHDGIAGPITSGVLRPVIALPSIAVKWSQAHVANALVHELAHVRRRDWMVHLTARTVCAFCWFHPLAWLTWRVLRLEAERACDDAVVARADAATYATQLLELARHLAHKPALAVVSMAGSSDLSTRIRSVLDTMRPRGRAGKLAVACTVLVAGLAVAALATLRPTATADKRMYRAAELLAKRVDADSLAAAGLLIAFRQPDQAVGLVAQASLRAPERADLVWLHIQICGAVASCDPQPLERRLRALDANNGAGWFGAMVRAGNSDDEEAKSAAWAAIARTPRVDIYWTTLIARLSPQVASTKLLSLHEANTGVIGVLAGIGVPAYKFAAGACKSERLIRNDELELCRGIARSFLNGDAVITEMMGAGMAMRAWPENSPEWARADDAKRVWAYQIKFAGEAEEWMRTHESDFLTLSAQRRREQDVHKALLIAMGKSPLPAHTE